MVILPLFILLFSAQAFSHGGDDGPSTLEDQFAQTSHLHLPVTYSTAGGLSFGLHFNDDHSEEDGEETEHEHAQHAGEDHGDTHESETPADDTGLEVNIHPQATGGYEKIRRFIDQEVSESQSDMLEVASPNAPYILLENKKWDLGLGLEAEVHLPNPLFSAGIGFTYLRGKNYYTKRILKFKHENREALELPVSADSLRTWRPGDEMAYATKGSLIFNVVVGIDPVIHFGPLYAHTGTFRYRVRMEDDETLEVEVMTLTSDSFSLEGSAIIIDGEAGKSRGFSKSITFDFDLKNPMALRALDSLFRGRLDLTNDALLKSGGAIHLRTDLFNRSTSLSGSFGLPIVYTQGLGQGHYTNIGTLTDEDNDKAEVYSTAFVKENFTKGMASKKKWENQSIISTVVTGKKAILSSVFSWSYSLEKATAKGLRKKFYELAQLFGIPRLTKIEFPFQEIGYIKADFGLNLSGRDILNLLNAKALQELRESAVANLERDFKAYGHRPFCQLRNYQNCLGLYKTHIQSKAAAIELLKKRIEAAHEKRVYAQVTRDLTKLTKTLFSSRYLTQAFLRSSEGVVKELRLEGENIKKHSFTSL